MALEVARPPAPVQEAARPLALKVAPPPAQETAQTLALEVARPPAPEAARLLVPEVARPSAQARVMAHEAPCPRHWKGARKREKSTITSAGTESPESPGAERPRERTRPTGGDCRVRRGVCHVRRPMASACA